MVGSDDGGKHAGVRHLSRRLRWGFLGRKPSDGDACGCRYPVEGVASLAPSSMGGNPVHSLDVRWRRIQRRNLPEGVVVEFGSVSPMASASGRPVYPFFNGWVCFGCMAFAAGGVGGRGWKSELLLI
jgi:hypothetical protein